jgi:hypothetical protein
MKHIQTFESFVNNINEGFEPKMIDNRGMFDTGYISFVWEDALTWAFGQNLGLKNRKEIEDAWNTQTDDRNSELSKQLQGNFLGSTSDIEWSIRGAENIPDAIREGVKQLRDRLSALQGIFASAEKAPSFVKLEREAVKYADKLEKETPLEPVKIDISAGEYVKTKGIRAKEYFEAGERYFKYNVVVLFKDGRAMKGTAMYASEREVGSQLIRLSGNDLAKVKEFYSKYSNAISSSDDTADSYGAINSVMITISDMEKTYDGDIAKADALMKSKIVPGLKRAFPDAEVNF